MENPGASPISMKRILVCTDGSVFAQSSYHYAAWLANRLQAAVDVLYVTDARHQAAAAVKNLSGSIGFGASDVLLKQLVDLEHEKNKLDHHRAKLILADAKAVLSQQGVDSVQVIHETGVLVDCLGHFEEAADLIVLGKRGETAEFAPDHLGSNMERLIRASYRPCLATVRQFRPIDRLALAYDGGPSCQKILDFLGQSPAFQGLELHILTVAKTSRDAKGNDRLDQARTQAQATGLIPIYRLLEGNPDAAITQYVQDQNISLLLMGAYGHTRIRHLIIGSTTTQLLRHTQIPLLLFR